jgi:hypothetical protein
MKSKSYKLTGRRYSSVEQLMRGEKIPLKVVRQYRRLLELERRDVRWGMKAVVQLVRDWDRQLAPALHGVRFSDILACKLNLTKRRKPRKFKSQSWDLLPETAHE